MPIPVIVGAAAGAVGAAKAVGAAGAAAKLGVAAVGATVGGCAAVAADEVARNLEPETEVLPKPGSIIITKLMFSEKNQIQFEWHSGVYIGGHKIVEVKGGPGRGRIRTVTPNEFIRHKDLFGRGINLFVSCDKSGNVLADKSIARKAKNKIGQRISYHGYTNNCHQFSRGCITGDFKGRDRTIETKRALGKTIRKQLNYGNEIRWCSWETE